MIVRCPSIHHNTSVSPIVNRGFQLLPNGVLSSPKNRSVHVGDYRFPPWLVQVGANLVTRRRNAPQRPVLLSTLACPSGSEFGNQTSHPTLFVKSGS